MEAVALMLMVVAVDTTLKVVPYDVDIDTDHRMVEHDMADEE